jgi:hypothetical protein
LYSLSTVVLKRRGRTGANAGDLSCHTGLFREIVVFATLQSVGIFFDKTFLSIIRIRLAILWKERMPMRRVYDAITTEGRSRLISPAAVAGATPIRTPQRLDWIVRDATGR